MDSIKTFSSDMSPCKIGTLDFQCLHLPHEQTQAGIEDVISIPKTGYVFVWEQT